jgi:phosphonate transport system substrate-binding protein
MPQRRRAMPLALTALLAVTACAGGVAPPAEQGAGTTGTPALPTAPAMTATAGPVAAATIDAATIGTAANPIVMSFVPAGDPGVGAAGGDEIARLLKARTGLAIQADSATSYADIIEAMGTGTAHVGWLPSFAYLLANGKYQVRPILVVERNGSTTATGQIVAGASSGVKSLVDLAGKVFCRPDGLSTAGWIAPSLAMQAAGLDPARLGEVVDTGTDASVVTSVYNLQCDAGATAVDARDLVARDLPDVKGKVVVIATADPIPNDTVSVVAGLPDAVTRKIADGLMALTRTAAGRRALRAAYAVDRLQPIDDTLYDGFRATLSAAGVNPQDYLR